MRDVEGYLDFVGNSELLAALTRVSSACANWPSAGIDHGAIMFIERGERQPSPSAIRNLTGALGVEPGKVISWDDTGDEPMGH